MLKRTVDTNLSLNERLARLERKVGVNPRNKKSLVREGFKRIRPKMSLSEIRSLIKSKLRKLSGDDFEVFGLNPQNRSDNTEEFIDVFGLKSYKNFVSFSYLDSLIDSNEELAIECYFINIEPVDEEEGVPQSQDYDGNFYSPRSQVTGEYYKEDNYTGEYLGLFCYLISVNGEPF